MKVGICTLGCKVNTYESEYLIQELEAAGYEIQDFNDINDVYIINTCTVTNTADIKSRKMIHQAKKRNSDSCVVAAGCFVEANGQEEVDGVDIYIGTKNKNKIISLLDEYFINKQPLKSNALIEQDAKDNTLFEDMFLTHFEGRCRAFVKIQDGCENFCSYCIIPFVRGKCRSKALPTVVKEVTALVAAGYQEVVLTGIHTGNYGVDLGICFADLLKELVKIEGLKRLRISSIEETELTPQVLDILRQEKVIVDHLHIPLQAGSDHILSLMNRKYTLQQFEHTLQEIRKIRKDIAITTDIIVGFPGESEEDFASTLAVAKKFAFAKIHVFPFSPRKGTKAMELPDHLDGSVKKSRSRALVSLSNQLEKEYATSFVGKTLSVLIEEYKDGYSIGHTSNYLKVKIKQELETNTFYDVMIQDYLLGCCLGQVCKESVCQL